MKVTTCHTGWFKFQRTPLPNQYKERNAVSALNGAFTSSLLCCSAYASRSFPLDLYLSLRQMISIKRVQYQRTFNKWVRLLRKTFSVGLRGFIEVYPSTLVTYGTIIQYKFKTALLGNQAVESEYWLGVTSSKAGITNNRNIRVIQDK